MAGRRERMEEKRFYRAELAAAYLGVPVAHFNFLVSKNALPQPRGVTPFWSMWALDRCRQRPELWECKVYVVGFLDYVKIGFTRDEKTRLKAIGDSLPVPLTVYRMLYGTPELEADLHSRFAATRLRGEWFRNEGALAEWIASGCPA